MSTSQLWQPMGTQSALVSCPGEEILFAGKKNSGRTSGVLGHWLMHADAYGKDAYGVVFRRQYRDSINWFSTTEPVFRMIGANFSASTMTWMFRNRAKIKIRHAEDVDEADVYAGNSFSWICFEHAEDWPDAQVIDRMRMFHRSPSGVAKCQMLLTADTAKATGTWIEERFVSHSPDGWDAVTSVLNPATMTSRIFIPARLTATFTPVAKREIDYSAITRDLVG